MLNQWSISELGSRILTSLPSEKWTGMVDPLLERLEYVRIPS